MIGWIACSFTCGCLNEDACLKAPKNEALIHETLERSDPRRAQAWDGRPNGVRQASVAPTTPPRAPEKPAGAFNWSDQMGSTPLPQKLCACGPGLACRPAYEKEIGNICKHFP